MRSALAAGLVAVALGAGLLVTGGAGSATAATGEDAPSCTVTAAERAATVDQLHALREQLRAVKPTAVERAALQAAIAEIKRAARDQQPSAALRAAKGQEIKTLAAKLETATSHEQRVAIRAEMRAIQLDLKTAALTRADKAELRAKVAELRAQLAPKRLTKAQRREVLTEMRQLRPTLECTVSG